VLVLALDGVAWGLYRDVTAGISTTDVIAGGGDGGPLDVLLVGVDSRTDAHGNPLPQEVLAQLHTGGDNPAVLNSDTIILLHVPRDGGAVAFSIPRDSYVDIPGYRRDKINAAYPAVQALTAERLVREGVQDRARVDAEAAQAGRSALIGAVQALTGVTVDHFAEVNLLGFANLTRAVGGVDVCLRAAVDDPLSGARFPAGPRTVAGADALAFVRQRHGLPDGDLSRIRRQQVFLAAVADKVLSGGTLTDPAKLTGLVRAVQESVVLDNGFDLLAFARQASGMAAGDLEFLTVPTGGTATNARGSVLQVDPERVRAFVAERAAARAEAARRERAARDEAPAAPAPPPPLTIEADHYVVHVRNGSGVDGLAGRVLGHLGGLGFVRGTVDTAADRETSVVRHRDSDDAAEAVAEQLGGMEVEQDDAVPSGHLQVVLGADAPRLVPALVPAPSAPGAAPPADGPITAAGVPCVD
jgi:LCP family protein required for cell wall assembly